MKKDNQILYLTVGLFTGVVLGILLIMCAYNIGKDSEEALKNAILLAGLIDFMPFALIFWHRICCDLIKQTRVKRQKRNGV